MHSDLDLRGLQDADLSSLMKGLVEDRHLRRRVGLAAIEGGSDDPVGVLGRSVERDVFGAEFANSPEELACEYGPYDSASRFVVVGDFRARRPVGVMRLVSPGVAGLKSINDLEKACGVTADDFLFRERLDDFETCLDIATLAVHPDYRGAARGHRVTALLYRSLLLITLRQRTRRLVAILDDTALRSVRFIEPRVRPVVGTAPFPYLGSPRSHAVVIPVDDPYEGLRTRVSQLRRHARLRVGDLRNPRSALRRQLIARGVENIATGHLLDRDIRL